jgi:hypothetical protein
MRRRWEEIPFATLAPALGCGMAASIAVFDYSFALLAVGMFFILGAAMIAWWRNRLRFSFWLAHASILLAGLLLALSRRDGFSSIDVRALLARSRIPVDELLLFDG